MTRRARLRIAARAAAVLLCAWALPALAQEERNDDLLTSGKKLYSQGKEELIIRHFFRDRRGGFFVDVGAWEWRRKSTTYYLEKHLGWSGIAIDALPHLAAGYEKHRPRTRFFHYIVTDHSGTMEPFFALGPLSSADPEWHEQFTEKKRVARRIEVPTITLTELLEQAGVDEIDFLSMDIEGGSPRALAGFDIERFRPELVGIEASDGEAVTAYFEAHGYERIEEYLRHDLANWWFRPSDPAEPIEGG